MDMQVGFAMRSQVDVLLVAIVVSVSITALLLLRPEYKVYSYLDKISPLPYFLNYSSPRFNTTYSILIKNLCRNDDYFNEFFNESIDVMHYLNGNKSFILFINISGEYWEIYDDVPQVCLNELSLSRYKFIACNKEGEIIYGDWRGEAPKC